MKLLNSGRGSMKRLEYFGPLVVICLGFLLLTLVAQPTAQTFTASSGFSGVQGQNGWFYLDSKGAMMAYSPPTLQWKGTEPYSLIWNSGGHPGSQSDSVRRWKPPGAGTITINGKAADANGTGGNGVQVQIKKNAAILWQQAIANGNATGFPFVLSTSVLPTDVIDFVIQAVNGDNNYDSTNFDPTVVYTAAGMPEPPVPNPIPTPPPSSPPTPSPTPTPGAGNCLAVSAENLLPLIPCMPKRRRPLGEGDDCICGEEYSDPKVVAGDTAPKPTYGYKCHFDDRTGKWGWRNWLLEAIWHPPQ